MYSKPFRSLLIFAAHSLFIDIFLDILESSPLSSCAALASRNRCNETLRSGDIRSMWEATTHTPSAKAMQMHWRYDRLVISRMTTLLTFNQIVSCLSQSIDCPMTRCTFQVLYQHEPQLYLFELNEQRNSIIPREYLCKCQFLRSSFDVRCTMYIVFSFSIDSRFQFGSESI